MFTPQQFYPHLWFLPIFIQLIFFYTSHFIFVKFRSIMIVGYIEICVEMLIIECSDTLFSNI